MFRLNRNERSYWSGNGVHVESELVFMIGRNMQEYRYWFFMHSEPISKQSARSASAITSISRSLFDLNW